MQTLNCEELLEELDKIEQDIQELVDYKAEVYRHKRSVRGWARFTADMKLILVRRQIDRHLVYLKLQRRIAQDCYKRLQDDLPEDLQEDLQKEDGQKPLV